MNHIASSPDPMGARPNEASAALRAAFALFDRWQITAAEGRQLLGLPSMATYQRWRNEQPDEVPEETLLRIGSLLGIHKALRYMFTEPVRGYDWVRRPNDAFAGSSALDVMMGGGLADLVQVRAYLDAERAAW